MIAVLLPVLCGSYLIDLDIYRAGGLAARSGGDLYGFHVGIYGFTYPPFAGLLFSGYACVPLAVASVVMTILSAAALVVFVLLSAPDLVRRVREAPAAAPVIALSALVVCEPMRSTIRNGQIELVLAAMIVLDLVVLRRGVLVGVAAAIKLTPAVFVLHLILCRRFREARNAVAVFALIAAFTAIVLPGDSWRFWSRVMWAGSGIGDLSRPDNQSLLGLANRLFGTSAAGVVWPLAAVGTIGAGLAIAHRAHRRGAEVLAIGTIGVTGCLVSPVSWTHHWVWCVPWLVGLWEVAVPCGRWARGGVVALGVLFLIQGPPLQTGSIHAEWARVLGTGFVPAALLCWSIPAVVGLVRGGRPVHLFAVRRRFLHSPGVSARPDLALVYPECQLESPVRPTAGVPARPSVAGTTDSGSHTYP